MIISSDYLVIGSGIAGLSFALKIAEKNPKAKIHILTKNLPSETNTKYAQGGIAAVKKEAEDSRQSHIEDTLKASDYTSNPEIVKMVVSEGAQRIEDLLGWKVDFDVDDFGEPALVKEGGHSYHRIFHHKDFTGSEIMNKLVIAVKGKSNIHFFENHHAFKLNIFESHCFGVDAFDEKKSKIITFEAPHTILATGGLGRIYQTTTNPEIATGDGIAMALEHGVESQNLSFIQFHPTTFYDTKSSFLITEALRGKGAFLLNHRGERFMKKYDPREELASRDIVSRAIVSEMESAKKPFVLLDCRHIPKSELKTEFPNVYESCKNKGLSLERDLIPVCPAAHYSCGGIVVNDFGQTNINGLYASGECTFTGLHGANRLASNALLEALVYSHRAAMNILKQEEKNTGKSDVNRKRYTAKNKKQLSLQTSPALSEMEQQIRITLQQFGGIIKTNRGLIEGRKLIVQLEKELQRHAPYYSLQSIKVSQMVLVAKAIFDDALNQKENKGVFFNKDLGK